jgi:hypothetical protein
MQVIATAHGTEMKHLLQNKELCALVGGVHTIVLGDEEARKRKLRSKSVRERKGPPVFDTIIELRSQSRWAVYHDVAGAIDAILSGTNPIFEIRSLDPETGNMQVTVADEFV